MRIGPVGHADPLIRQSDHAVGAHAEAALPRAHVAPEELIDQAEALLHHRIASQVISPFDQLLVHPIVAAKLERATVVFRPNAQAFRLHIAMWS